MAEASPMLAQYRRIKHEHRDAILFFRLGDFYEMFAEDAVQVSALLNLTLTSRNGQPMCGVPYHAARVYIGRLLKLGMKIAICEQMTKPGKGLVDRQVVETITPGTTVDEDFLDTGNANYLAAIARSRQDISFSYIDVSTGEFFAGAFPAAEAAGRVRQELERIQARELIAQESLLGDDSDLAAALDGRSGLVVNRWPDWLFDQESAAARLERQFGTANLKGFGLERTSPEVMAAGALLSYLDDTAGRSLDHIRTLRVYRDDQFVDIDEAAQRNLELTRNMRDGDSRFSLFEILDETRSAMGVRLLKRRILRPLRDVGRIRRRLDRVETLYRSQGQLTALRDCLGKTLDLERLCSRVAMDKAHARDLVAVRQSLAVHARARSLAAAAGLEPEPADAPSVVSPSAVPPEADPSVSGPAPATLEELAELLERGIKDDPSILLSEGNMIRDGYDADLDKLRRVKQNSRVLLEAYLAEERAASGIINLKIRYNRLIGYFFEVNKANLAAVPDHFIRRQGIAGGERFSTERLAQLESTINGAEERIFDTERRLFMDLRAAARRLIPQLLLAAAELAELDVSQSLAQAATVRGWTKPEVNDRPRLSIAEGRHPVVEAHLARGEFVPNDLELDGEGVSFALITGPNMAGKSTYLRQNALIALMAQIGSFVPARDARIGIVDKIFCRVGAADNLARGESTFLVEMNETAHILHAATPASLVIMDEVGRGTGTQDGLALAWAISEDLLGRVGCRCLFATHFHELARLEHPRLANRSMEVLETAGEIVFRRKIRDGAAAESYGLHVARLAGIPEPVIRRAAVLMDEIRRSQAAWNQAVVGATTPDVQPAPILSEDKAVLSELEDIDIGLTTPLGALALLQSFQVRLSGRAQPRSVARRTAKPSATAPEAPGLFD